MHRRTDLNAGMIRQVAGLAPKVDRSIALRVARAFLSRAVKTFALLGLGGTASLSFAESGAITAIQSHQPPDMSAWMSGAQHVDLTMAADTSSRTPATSSLSPAGFDSLQRDFPSAPNVIAYAPATEMRVTFRSTARGVASGTPGVKAGHAPLDRWQRRARRVAPVHQKPAVSRRMMVRGRLGSDASALARHAGQGTSSQAIANRMHARSSMAGIATGAVDANSADSVEGTRGSAINRQAASLGELTQNANASRLPQLALRAAAGAAGAAGSGSVALGGGATASGERSSAFGEAAVASGVGSVAIGADSVADRDQAVSVGSAGHERQIINVAPGTAPTDAVNVGQLDHATRGLNERIDGVDQSARRGIASASALNIVTPYLPGRTTLNAGIASYRGQAALGIGVSRWNQKGNVNLNLGISTAGGNSTIVRVGIGIVLRA
ncbi:hemagglutinin domain-containing protein [Caballeronia pedi]|uniref:Hemagglutinin domain-containing protein n=1 Tax=Caballeronia pedi TaxID=1777141 RepID=A0A158AVW7_9BURK|nr:YadA-like family protein [Caballeronia pedi]SAK61800.1 hemagglutinin domain-containing protein [Caballeronia pedi]